MRLRPLWALALALLVAGVALLPPPDRASAAGATRISAGGSHTCVVTATGTSKCWGRNNEGQLGNGTSDTHTTPSFVCVVVGSPVLSLDRPGSAGRLCLALRGLTAVGAGTHHTCAITAPGGVRCWGVNSWGELGDGQSCGEFHCRQPVNVAGLSSGVRAIAAGTFHTCVVTAARGVMCWGHNASGQLGDGTTTNRTTPANVLGLESEVVAVAAGFHTCAIDTEGGVVCWGLNDSGQLGDGTTTNRSTPVEVSGLGGRAAAIAAGGEHTCALTTAGGVKCWGDNEFGQLGDGTTTDRSAPTYVLGLTGGVAAIAAGADHTCAVTNAADVVCWGWNEFGQLGDGTTTNRNSPVRVTGLDVDISSITAAIRHTCAVSEAGSVWCWGSNTEGQLGNGTVTSSLTPVAVVNLGTKIAGDANCDGTVTAVDAGLILQLIAGMIGSLPCQENADANAAGAVDAIDAALVLQFVAGLIPDLPP